MILTLMLLAILTAVTGMLVREGLWRSLLMFFNVLAAAAIVYFIVCWSLSELANQLEQRIARQRLGDDQSGTGMLPPDAPKLQGAT